jgi:tripartite-type tricarboxylate transporter receptor subunit TctC
LPTLQEAGLDIEADAWVGLIAPANTPATIIESLHRSVANAVQSPAVRQKFEALMMQPVGGTPKGLGDLMAAEIARWKPVIDGAKIKPE